MFYTQDPIKLNVSPERVTPMLLSIQAVSYLHSDGPLPDSHGGILQYAFPIKYSVGILQVTAQIHSHRICDTKKFNKYHSYLLKQIY